MSNRSVNNSGVKRSRIIAALSVVALLVGTAAVLAKKPKKGDTLTVRVIRAKVMKKPKFIGAVSGSLSRGDKLKFVKAKGQWYKVDGASAGWIHKGQVAVGNITLSSKEGKGGDGGASREEVELAGRGFTPEVEKKYKSRNPKLDFSHVDLIEAAEVSPQVIEDFVIAGNLAGGSN